MPTSVAYRGAVRLATALLPAMSHVDAKLRRGHLARRGAADRLRAWAAENRAPERPLVWFHAPSVGEGLQAEAVLRELRAAHPDWQVAYTHFSNSAEGLARRIGADVADYLPYDTPAAADTLLTALRPSALVYSKLDLWPELATRAAASGTAVALVAGTVRPGSGRLRWPARPLLASGYAALSAAGAIDAPDAERLARLGVRPEVIEVLGDPRYDSVAAKVAAVPATDPLLRLGAAAPTLVAGSTWPGDEAVLLRAFREARSAHPEARLILVPHEPTPEHLRRVEAMAAEAGVPVPVRLSAITAPAPLVLVDRVGVLAALYGAGTMAYVGGGYHAAGLHSVLEPAAWGVPVAFGPRWRESRDAVLLADAGAAIPLPESGDAAVAALTAAWRSWIANGAERDRQGRAARGVVDRGLGAAGRSAALVSRLVRRERPA